MRLVHGPDWPGNALYIVAALVWLITAIGYLGNVAAQHRWKQELSDQTMGPFTSLLFIVPVLLSVPLAEQARGAGEVVFGCAAVADRALRRLDHRGLDRPRRRHPALASRLLPARRRPAA